MLLVAFLVAEGGRTALGQMAEPQVVPGSGATYVALGDSYTAGPFIPMQSGEPGGMSALRSRLSGARGCGLGRRDLLGHQLQRRTSSIGHDACQLPSVKWVEGAVPAAPAAPVHPNALGWSTWREAGCPVRAAEG